MGTPKKLLNMVRLSGDNFDLIRLGTVFLVKKLKSGGFSTVRR